MAYAVLFVLYFFNELIRRQVNLTQDFTQQRTGQIPASMIWESRSSTIRMAIENMAAFLPYGLKTKLGAKVCPLS
jgi:hypothetical protein